MARRPEPSRAGVSRVRVTDESGVTRLGGTLELEDELVAPFGIKGESVPAGGFGATVVPGSAQGSGGGDASLEGGGSAGFAHSGGGFLARGATAGAEGRVLARSFGSFGAAGEALVPDGTVDSTLVWGGVIVAAGVPAGAPNGKLPIAVDTTAVSGGIYVWNGAAWVKAATI